MNTERLNITVWSWPRFRPCHHRLCEMLSTPQASLSKENVPEVSGGRTEQQNYEQLFERLDYVASKGRICDDNQKELIVNYCKELQRLCVE